MTTRSPQFTLKTLLWLMAGICTVFGVAVMYPPHSEAAAVPVAGLVIGACIGASRSRAHAIVGAFLGFFVTTPLMFVVALLL